MPICRKKFEPRDALYWGDAVHRCCCVLLHVDVCETSEQLVTQLEGKGIRGAVDVFCRIRFELAA